MAITMYGYLVRFYTVGGGPNAGEPATPMVEVDLRADGKVELTDAQYQAAVKDAHDSATFKAAILGAKEANAREWAPERGPDSDLGRGIEQGQQATDHSSE